MRETGKFTLTLPLSLGRGKYEGISWQLGLMKRPASRI